jgi:hypothetical protein
VSVKDVRIPTIRPPVYGQAISNDIQYFQVELSEFLCGEGVGTLRISIAINKYEVSKKDIYIGFSPALPLQCTSSQRADSGIMATLLVFLLSTVNDRIEALPNLASRGVGVELIPTTARKALLSLLILALLALQNS